MPRSIRNENGWTLRKLVQNTYHNKHTRFEYKERDVLRSVIIRKISVYKGKNPGEARTKFEITSRSYPQYKPYYTGKDNRNRPIRYQRTYRHEYDVILQMDSLSIDDTRIRLGTGADAKWDFSDKGKGTWTGKGRSKKYQEGSNIKRGINGDFFFRLEDVYQQNGILYGRNWTNGPSKKVNPHQLVFLDKHMLRTVEFLMNKGILT